MSKTKEQRTIEALEARVLALEAHNGWTGRSPKDDPDTESTSSEKDTSGDRDASDKS